MSVPCRGRVPVILSAAKTVHNVLKRMKGWGRGEEKNKPDWRLHGSSLSNGCVSIQSLVGEWPLLSLGRVVEAVGWREMFDAHSLFAVRPADPSSKGVGHPF